MFSSHPARLNCREVSRPHCREPRDCLRARNNSPAAARDNLPLSVSPSLAGKLQSGVSGLGICTYYSCGRRITNGSDAAAAADVDYDGCDDGDIDGRFAEMGMGLLCTSSSSSSLTPFLRSSCSLLPLDMKLPFFSSLPLSLPLPASPALQIQILISAKTFRRLSGNRGERDHFSRTQE